MIRWMVVFLMAAIVSPRAFATTILFERSVDNVTIAIDSGNWSVQSGKVTPTSRGCNVRQFGNTLFASVGLVRGEGFDIEAVAQRAAVRIIPLDQRVEAFSREAIPLLEGSMRRIKAERPADFKVLPQEIVEVAFATLQFGLPALAVQSFRVGESKTGQVVVSSKGRLCPGDCKDGMLFGYLGVHAAIFDYFSKGGKVINPTRPAPFMKLLFGLELNRSSPVVTEPVSIVVLDRLGPRWEPGSAGLCGDILKGRVAGRP